MLTGAIIDARRGFVHLESGETLPVTNWFDADGYDCSPGDACALVCGPDRDGMWVSLEVFADEAAPTLNQPVDTVTGRAMLAPTDGENEDG